MHNTFNYCITVWTEDCCIAHTLMDKVRHMYVCWMVDKKALYAGGVFLDGEVLMKRMPEVTAGFEDRGDQEKVALYSLG